MDQTKSQYPNSRQPPITQASKQDAKVCLETEASLGFGAWDLAFPAATKSSRRSKKIVGIPGAGLSAGRRCAAARLGAFFDVVDDVAHGLQFLRVFVWHFHRKFFLKLRQRLDDIERISA